MQSSSPPRWRSVRVDAIALREWDGEFVVRNDRTGNSHMLGTLAGRVLRVLLSADHSLATAEITARLEAVSPELETKEAPNAIDGVLAEFSRLGLAELERT